MELDVEYIKFVQGLKDSETIIQYRWRESQQITNFVSSQLETKFDIKIKLEPTLHVLYYQANDINTVDVQNIRTYLVAFLDGLKIKLKE